MCQKKHKAKLKTWKDKHHLECRDKVWYKGQALVVTSNESDQRALLKVYHDALTARHLRAAKTLQSLSQDYWWLEMRKFTQSYI
jgi:hypothetical protein